MQANVLGEPTKFDYTSFLTSPSPAGVETTCVCDFVYVGVL